MELLAMSYGCILQPNKAVSALLGGWGQGFHRWLIRVVEQKSHGRRSPIAGDHEQLFEKILVLIRGMAFCEVSWWKLQFVAIPERANALQKPRFAVSRNSWVRWYKSPHHLLYLLFFFQSLTLNGCFSEAMPAWSPCNPLLPSLTVTQVKLFLANTQGCLPLLVSC